jgi:KaiC/GvpD/RAD55 family RecA-like ATPase
MSIINAVLAKINLVELAEEYTELKPTSNSGELRGVCPLPNHPNATNPTSFCVINEDYYYCHGCGSHGGVIQLFSEMEGLGFYGAIEKLAEKAQINIGDDKEYCQQKDIVRNNTNNMVKYQKQVDKVRQHLKEKRMLTDEVIENFKIGFDEQGDFLSSHGKPETIFPGIIFPIFDSWGRCAGFSKRRTNGDSQPKYKNSYADGVFEKGSILYNYHRIRKTIHLDKTLYLCEGFYDIASCEVQGLNAVGYLSGGLTKNHIGILKDIDKMHKGMTYIAMMDNDSTGIKEVQKLREKMAKYNANLNMRVFIYPQEDFTFPNGEVRKVKDPNDLAVLSLKIKDFPTQHIDIHCLEVILDKCKDIEAQYHEVALYMPTVKSIMIKADVARMLSKRWNQSIEDVTNYLQMSKASISDNILKEFKGAMECVKECEDMILHHDGITIGFPSIDKSLDGLRKGDVLFVAARPSVGKTFFAMEIALHQAIRLKLNILFFSLEMSAASLYERIIANIYKMNVKELREKVKDKSFDYAKVFTQIQKYLKVIDTPGLTMEQIEERIMIANTYDQFDGKVDVVIIDYVQLIQGMAIFADFEAKVTAFKPMARKYNIILIPLSQMNRTVKSWEECDVSMMKGGGSLEATGDVILLLWKTGENPALSKIEQEELENVISCKIGKARRDSGQKFFELEAVRAETTIRERIQ